MKRTKMTFLLSEICLLIMLLLCMHLIFSDEKPQKRVAVIVEKSGDDAYAILRVENNDKALEAFTEGGFTILSAEKVYSI